MSLLGRLLSGAGAPTSNSSPRTTLESNVEDQFTHNLLFPDPESLCHNDQVFPLTSGTILSPAAVSAFDISSEIDLEMRDVRVIIVQEATPQSGAAQLLYDSHTPPPVPTLERQASNNGPFGRSEGRRSISSPRKSSIGQNSRPVVIQPEPPAPRTFGAFGGRPQHNKTLSYTETEGQRSAREYREEVTTFSSCIFGNSEVLAYKGTGTKVHILPSESKPVLTSSSYMGDTNGSLGRSSMRGSKLAQSFTSDAVHGPTSAGFTSPSTSTSTRGSERKKVLITRMFPVPLPNDDTEDVAQNSTPTPQNVQSAETAGYPFPKVGENGLHGNGGKKPQPKQKRTPMYAVGLVIHLPAVPRHASAPTSRSSFRGPSSYTEQESYPSSYNSTKRSGWTMLGHGFGVESMDSSFSSDTEDRIDAITQHWDIIGRTMSYLQSVATASLLPMLKQADISSPDPRRETFSHGRAPSASISVSGKRVLEDIKQFKVPKTNAKLVQLTANCLMQVPSIHKEVDASRQRIISGIKANQAVTGQGRWGIWREEARLVGKWGGGKEQGFFFQNLLTGFLGSHTEWLQALGPSWYRRRHYHQQKSNKDEDIPLPARTVIVSDNKLMARRLIFLLSAFLPANQQLPGMRHRPSTSTSFGGYSNSPPTYAVPILREESLRRRINKRTGPSARGGVHSRAMSFPAQIFAPPPPEPRHDRRTSDAASIKTANLPIPGCDIVARKSSAATTSTIMPATTAAHFSVGRPIRGTGPMPRPGSSGSLANEELQRTLHRGDSSGQFSNTSSESLGQGSRWSVLSGLWGGSRRRESTASSSVEPLSMDGLEIHDPHYKGLKTHKRGKLQEMVEEATACSQKANLPEREQRKSESGSATTAKPEEDQIEDVPEQIIQIPERVPDPNGAFESPIKTSINEDGVIDIDVPLPDYLSFETAVSSPSSSGYLSTHNFGGNMDLFEQTSRASPDVDTTLNVGGWLQHFHPDFALQAVPSEGNIDILEQVKASMRAEPTPIHSSTPHPDHARERWVDVCSALIADTTNFSIKLIRYRRLVKPKVVDHISQANSAANSMDSLYGNVYTAAQLTPGLEIWDGYVEGRFIEEAVISMDETLIEAVERIIAQSGGGNSGGGGSSRSSAYEGEAGREEVKTEVPRGECKKTVLGALEEIVKEVVGTRRVGEDGRDRESLLREGVRGWLECVEGAGAE